MTVLLSYSQGSWKLIFSNVGLPSSLSCSFCLKRKPILKLLDTELLSDVKSTPFTEKVLKLIEDADVPLFQAPIGVQEKVVLLSKRHVSTVSANALERALSMLLRYFAEHDFKLGLLTLQSGLVRKGTLSHPQVRAFFLDIDLPRADPKNVMWRLAFSDAEREIRALAESISRNLGGKKELVILISREELLSIVGSESLPWPISSFKLAGFDVEVESDE